MTRLEFRPAIASLLISHYRGGAWTLRAQAGSGRIHAPKPLAYVGWEVGDTDEHLWIRRLADTEPRLLAGTEGARFPFWSPDSRELGFFAAGKMKRVSTTDGVVVEICDAPDGRGGTWSRDGMIVFAPRPGNALLKVPSGGGDPRPVTAVTAEGSTHRWPRFLPDGKQLVFVLAKDPSRPTGLYLTDVDGSEPRLLLEGDSEARLAGNRLLYTREGTLMALPVDLKSLQPTGPPEPIAQGIRFNRNRWTMAVSATERLLVYRKDLPTLRRLTWFDRDGKQKATIGEPGMYGGVALAPDGSRALVGVGTKDGKVQIWMLDTAKGGLRRFTLIPDAYGAKWSPGGSEAAFVARRDGGWDLVVASTVGSGDERVVVTEPTRIGGATWSPDGQHLVYQTQTRATGKDLLIVPTDGSQEPRPIVATTASENTPRVSPDGRWLAYGSDESGRREVYLVTFPAGERKRQITNKGVWGGGIWWSADGSMLAYWGTDFKLWGASVRRRGGDLQFGAARALLGDRDFDVVALDFTSDFERALGIVADDPGPPVLTLVQNWQQER